MEVFIFRGREEFEKGFGVLAGVDDAEGMGGGGEFGGDGLVAEGAAIGDIYAGEVGKESFGILDDFTGVWEADGEVGGFGDGGLGGGAEDGGGVVAGGEFFEDAEAGFEVVDGEALGFVEDDDGVGDVVEFAGAGGFAGVEGFVELDGGGDDDGGVPVFSGEPGGGGLAFFLIGGEVGVVFDEGCFAKRGEEVAEDGGVLLDDGGEGDYVDDAPLVVGDRVAEGETEG